MAEKENSSPEINFVHPSEAAPPTRRKRNLPGMPDPDAQVIALSPETLMATNRFVCEICSKGFQREQNLQLHMRGHNMPWKLRQRNPNEVVRKRVYVCPEIGCVHHHPSRALGDLTGIKKHFCRKHGDKKYRCDRCFKPYAVDCDRKAHMKTCGTREYACNCGTTFSRRDSFMTHKTFCVGVPTEGRRRPQRHFDLPSSSGVLSPGFSKYNSAELSENQTAYKQPSTPATSPTSTVATASGSSTSTGHIPLINNNGLFTTLLNSSTSSELHQSSSSYSNFFDPISLSLSSSLYTPTLYQNPQPALSATALLQKAAQIGSTSSFLQSQWVAPPHPRPMDSGLGLGLPVGSSSLSYRELMMSDTTLFSDKPTTLDLLGLGIEGGEGSSGGFTAFFNGLDMPPSYGGETWEGQLSKKKPS